NTPCSARQLPTALEDPGNLPPTGTDQPTVSCSRSPDTCLSFMRYFCSTYKPLHRMTPKLREKFSSLFAVLWAYNHVSYNRPAGFTQPGHPTVAPLPPHLSPGICTDRGADSIPDGHSGYCAALAHGSSSHAPPGNYE